MTQPQQTPEPAARRTRLTASKSKPPRQRQKRGKNTSLPSWDEGAILKVAFGPMKWAEKASRILGLSTRQIHKIASGQAPMSRRTLVVIDNYLANKISIRSSAREAAIARAVRECEREYAGLAEARRRVHVIVRLGRQGTVKCLRAGRAAGC